MPRIVLISDTHDLQDRIHPVPDGDILIHAGDLTMLGRMNEIAAAGVWLRSLPHRHKIYIAGNHDWMFEKNRTLAMSLMNQGIIGEGGGKLMYLQDGGVEVMGLRIYGSPWQPWFMNWAFNVQRGSLKKYWDMIPENLDVLVTHGPPMGILDQSAPHLGSEHLGDQELMDAVERVKPRVHVFGHIHGGYGKSVHENTTFVNAAAVNEAYKPVNDAWVIDLEPREKLHDGSQEG
jgi:Icc-related predicted phosphoesterase